MILVTGATGLLGNCCVRELLQRGESIRVLTRPGPARHELTGLDIEIIEGELSDRASIDKAVEGCKAVIHAAAMIHIGWTKLDEARRVNVEGTNAIVDACIRHRARLIHVSTVDTLPAARSVDEPISEDSPGIPKVQCTYVISKTESERLVDRSIQQGLDAIVVHPGFMLGPWDWKPSSGQMMLGLTKIPVPVAPRGSASICDARDVACAIANALTLGRSGQHYILAGENLTYVELWRRMLITMNRERHVYRMKSVIPFVVGVLDQFNRITGRPEGAVNSATIAMGHLHHVYCSDKAAKELRYSRRPLEQTLREAWLWLVEHHLPEEMQPAPA